MRNKKVMTIIIIGIIIIIGFKICFVFIANRYEKDHNFKDYKVCNSYRFNNKIDARLSKVTDIKDYPSKYIIDSLLNCWDYTELIFILNSMDSSHLPDYRVQYVNILTDSLFDKYRPGCKIYNPDLLCQRLLWAERLKNYSEVDITNASLFEAISLYWFNKISDNLDSLSIVNSNIKFKYSFKYLITRCSQNKSKPNIHISENEKVINYIVEKRWQYLWNRLDIGTTILFKSIALLILLVILFGFYCSFLFIRKNL